MSEKQPQEKEEKISEESVIEAVRNVYDPEIPVNIYDLGLIYSINITDNNSVGVVMTLTTPNCPEAQTIPGNVQEAIEYYIPEVNAVNVEIVWEPKWTPDVMSEDAKLALGLI